MKRQTMVNVFATEYRKAVTRRNRIGKVHGVWGFQYYTADGKIDGIVAAAGAMGISFYEIEEAARV